MARIQFVDAVSGIEAHKVDCGHLEFRRRLSGCVAADEFLRGDFTSRDEATAACDRFLTGIGFDPAPVKFATCCDLG